MNFLRFKGITAFLLLTIICMLLAVSCENITIKTVVPATTEEVNPTASVVPDTTPISDGLKIHTQRDESGRVVEETAAIYKQGDTFVIYKKNFEYNEKGRITSISYDGGSVYVCLYDEQERIVGICKDGNELSRYYYSPNGYLIKEDNFEGGTSSEYTYDEKGNITGKRVYSFQDTSTPVEEYEYTYKNGRFEGAEYNFLGNPTKYTLGKEYVFTWQENGRILDSLEYDGVKIVYEYGAQGQRSAKSVNGVRYEYLWSKMKLSEVRIIDENGNESGKMVFSYTDDGTPVMFTYNGEEYYYKVNLLGDVEEIFTPKGVVGRYCYDGWGNILKTESLDGSDIININPIRYRGYLYDGETGLYYLHTRYYDPALGRRLNADGYSSGSSQGYVYAQNDPVGNIDSTMKVEYPLCNQLHLYSGNAKPVAGKINVLFMPTIANPVFQIENSYKIVDEAQQRAVLEYIMESEMYVQEIYCRTLESMLVEWKAHNRIFATSPNERCRHVDFDKNDEGLTYSDFWKRAMREYGIQIG